MAARPRIRAAEFVAVEVVIRAPTITMPEMAFDTLIRGE